VDRSRSEAVLVKGPRADYVFCVATKGQKDVSWGHDNEGFRLVRRVSTILWERFGGAPWSAPPGHERFRKGQ
jgi:beta-lactamase class A